MRFGGEYCIATVSYATMDQSAFKKPEGRPFFRQSAIFSCSPTLPRCQYPAAAEGIL
jgi:hypothetical protein